MARTGITYHDVANAIATLQGRQKNPTIDTIREELGTGSKSTIAKFMQEYKTKNGITNTNEMGIPNELQQLIRGLWEKIQSDANVKIEKHQLEADTEINDAKNSVALTQQQNALLHSEIKTLSEKLDDQTQTSEQLKNTINQCENEKTKLIERISSLESHNLNHKKENDRLHTLLKNTQDNLVHYQQAVEQQRHEQALLLEKQRSEYELKLSQLQNQLNVTIHEKTQYQTRFDSLTKLHHKLESDFSQEKNSNKLLQKNCDSLSTENTRLTNEVEKLNSHQNQLSQQLENKNNENSELYIQIKSSENINLSLKTQIDKLDYKMQALIDEHNKTLQEKYFLEANLNAKKTTEEIN